MDHTWPSCKAGSTNRSLSRAGGADSFWRCHEDLHLQRALEACLGSQNPADHCPSISWTGLSKKNQPAPCPASAWLGRRRPGGVQKSIFPKVVSGRNDFRIAKPMPQGARKCIHLHFRHPASHHLFWRHGFEKREKFERPFK